MSGKNERGLDDSAHENWEDIELELDKEFESFCHPTHDEAIQWEHDDLSAWWEKGYSSFDIPTPQNVEEWKLVMICAGYDWRNHLFFKAAGEHLASNCGFDGLTPTISRWVENRISEGKLGELQTMFDGLRRSSQEAAPPNLVTRKDVAALVHRATSGMSKYTKHWPEPKVAACGKIEAEWAYSDIYPKLKEQFPKEKNLPQPSEIDQN
ncbi:hypothetical protein [Symmachiella dynata]|uniref:hypothetical protein n=1 Tax=Symmachiella dynata TaxID=2527995 RepID=UPI0030ECC64B